MSQGPRWLLEALPTLEREGVIDAATAGRLRQRYASAATAPAWGRILSAVLGALLMGLGVILLLAHNWEQWPRLPRVLISLTPLLLGQAACLWAMTRANGDVAWREGSASFTVAAFAAALALVGQLYHLPSDLDRFLIVCAAAALPLAYLMAAHSVMVLYALLVCAWAGVGSAHLGWTLLALALMLPWLWTLHRQRPPPFVSGLLWTALPPLATLAVLLSLDAGLRMTTLWLAQVGALFWLASPPDERGRRGAPMRYGMTMVVGLAVAGSFTAFWSPGGLHSSTGDAASWLLVTAVMALLLWGAQRALREDQWLRAAGMLPATLLWLSLMFDPTPYAGPLALLCNLYLAVLGVALIREGIAQHRLRLAHTGLAILALLILLRFLDTELSFSARGVAFLLVGAGSLAFSRWLRQQVPT